MKGIRPEGWRAEENPNKVSPEVLSRSVPLRPRGIRCRRFVFFGFGRCTQKEVPYSIDFACFIKCLDKVAVVLVNSPMLARRLDHPPHRKSFPLILLRTLLHSQKSQLLCNQGNPNSFDKTLGVGGTPQIRPLLSTTSRLFFSGGANRWDSHFWLSVPGFKGMSRGAIPRQPSLFCLPSGRCLFLVR